MEVNDIVLKINSPGLYVFAGATNSVWTSYVMCKWYVIPLFFKGKSYLTRQLLVKHEHVFSRPIKKFYYCFSHWQTVFDELMQALGSKIEFIPNFSGISFFHENDLESRTADSEPIAIILDDCKANLWANYIVFSVCLGLEELLKSKDALTIFTRYVHHKNCVFFLQTQILLQNSDVYRSIVKVWIQLAACSHICI